MKFLKRKKKRKFIANKEKNLIVNNVGKIVLKKKDHLTIEINKKKNEICAFEWGMYATSSINKRLKKEGFKTFLVKNNYKKFFIMLVDKKKMKSFNSYLLSEKSKIYKKLG